MSFTSSAAEKVVSRSGERGIVLDPILISAIITSLMGCLFRNDDVSGTQIQDRVKRLNQKDPERLLKRTRQAVEHEYRKRGMKISKEKAAGIAADMIREMLFATPEFSSQLGKEVEGAEI